MNKKAVDEIKKIYSQVKKQIHARLREFERLLHAGSEKEVFEELVFCLLTPQSKAKACWATVNSLLGKNLLYKADASRLSGELNRVRFRNNKAKYIVRARGMFVTKDGIYLKSKIKQFKDIFCAREWLVKNVKGMGYKEASHFLRNIGLGKDIAILDRHILKNLKAFGVIGEIPKSLTRNRYMEIEERMKRFSKKIGIPLNHLDLLFWYKEAGEVFK